MNWLLDVDPVPALLVLPAGAESLDEAHAAIELWEHYTGKTLDSTQRLTVEVMMAQTADGRWAAKTTGREMPRQNGKGDELEVVELWGIVQRDEAILHTVHEAVLLTTQTQERLLSVIEGHPDLRRKLKRRWTGTGQQMIEMRGGGIIWYRTRSGGGGRGLDDVDRVVVDEAQHVTPEQLAATTPTGFANGNNQLNFAGTSGLEGESVEWWRVRKRALTAEPGAFGYVGHTVERLRLLPDGRVESSVDGDYADEGVIRSANPALKRKGDEGLAFLREQYQRIGPDLFAQEHLGVWAPPPDTSGDSGPIPIARWDALVDATSTPEPASACLAVATAPDQSWATIALAGVRSDGLHHVELVTAQPFTGWVVDRLAAIVGKLEHVRPLLPKGHALVGECERAGITVDEVGPAELATSTGRLIAGTQGEAPLIRHRGEPALRKSLQLATTSAAGKSGVVWSSPKVADDISPLLAVSMAYGRLGVTAEEPEPFFVY